MLDQPAYKQLPREHAPSASLSRLAFEILGALILVLLINWALIGYLANYSTEFGYWTIHQKWFLLGKLDSPVDWLILGDSSCNQGVVPAVLEEKLGGRALNLCMVGNITVLGDLWLLEEYLDRFGPPKGVIIVHVYDVWPRSLNPALLGQIPRPWGFWSEHTFGETMFAPLETRFELFMEHYVPLVSQTRTLGRTLRSMVFFQHNPFRPIGQLGEDGFLTVTEAKPEVVARDAQNHLDTLAENPFSISYINRAAFDQIVLLAEHYKMPVYLFNSPLYEGLYNDPAFYAYLEKALGRVSRLNDDSAYVRIQSEVMTFPLEEMQTVDHLILSAAEVYTNWIAGQISP